MRRKHKIQTSMKVIYAYGFGFIILFLINMVGWIAHQYFGLPFDSFMLDFFGKYTSVQVCGAVAFISIFFVDKDRDGRPDSAERQAENGNDKPPIIRGGSVNGRN